MLEHLRAPFKRLIEPFAKALVSLGLTANAVTVIGAIGTIVVAFATGITGWLFAGAVVLTLLVLADSLDGSIAALTTGSTQFGAFWIPHWIVSLIGHCLPEWSSSSSCMPIGGMTSTGQARIALVGLVSPQPWCR